MIQDGFDPTMSENWETRIVRLRDFRFVSDPEVLDRMHPNWPILENSIKDLIASMEKYLPGEINKRTQVLVEVLAREVLDACGFQAAYASVNGVDDVSEF